MIAIIMVGLGAAHPEPRAQRGEPLLLTRAKRLVNTDGWRGFVLFVPEYRWISSHELLYFEGTSVGDWKLMKLDLNTGAKTPLAGLSKTYNETPSGLGQVEVSPDGKRLLWASSRDDKPTWVVARLDGSERTDWRRLKMPSFRNRFDPFAWSVANWTDNGKAVMEASLERDGTRRSVRARLSIKGIEPATGPTLLARIPWPSMALPLPSAVDRSALLGYDDFVAIQNRPDDDVRVFRVRLSATGSSVTEQTVHLPQYANFYGAVPSPGGDRIAWQLGSPYDHTSRGVSEYMSPPSKRLPLGYWISRADGSGLRPLGHLRPDPRGAVWQYEHLGGLRWTPDGRHLSFVYNGVLYTVSVP